ncbi:MAG: DNA topoisomerase 3 [Candidatus Limisoma sp.]
MIVCITEKPSVAKDIAQILGASVRRDGYYEGNGYQITWTFGHLCCLKDPHDYTDGWRSWNLSTLPMLPPKFGIKLISDAGIEKQFKVIESLFQSADEIVNCGDAGQEGELIQRWVMQKAKCLTKPVKRLWISSLTDESIRAGFDNLKDQKEFDSLYYAGLSRAIGDWILGINATRLFTLKYSSGKGVLSVGRVQTPTLALIVQRQREIDGFVPEDFWEIKTKYRNVDFASTKGRFSTPEAADEVVAQIKGKPFVIKSCVTKRGKESAPKLFDLTSLQVECDRRYGFSADMTLQLIQSLYEKKFTTYPRVDTTYLSEDIYPKIPGILQAMRPYAALVAPLLDKKLPKQKKIFDNSKVTDHHAIIPTNVPPSPTLSPEEKRVYDLVARRFIAAFYPDCEFDQTTVVGNVEHFEFKASGKQIVKNGWRDVYTKGEVAQKDADDDAILPIFEIGESGPHEPSVVKKTTQPPKYYTEGTLLRAMETAGKLVDDEELREAMKENGIGRPSTRAAIIETLFKRRYIRKERKSIKATEAGMALIDTIKVELLKSAKLTGMWENKLRKIERKEYSASQFVDELKMLIREIVIGVLNDNSGYKIEVPDDKKKDVVKEKSSAEKKKRRPAIKSLSQIKCPVCGKGYILKGRNAFGCSDYAAGCRFVLPFTEAPEDTSPAKLNKIIEKKFKI